MTIDAVSGAGRSPLASADLRQRLRANALDRSVLTLPLVAATFCLLRALHLIALEPYWLYVVIVMGGGAVRVVYSAYWGDTRRSWHCNAYVGASAAVTAVVAYSTGWGPVLSIGFLFGAAVSFQLFGSKARVPCLATTAAAMTLGQIAIAANLAPTRLHGTEVQGVAGLGLLGALFVIELLGQAAAKQEVLGAELRGSERRFSALVNSSGDIVIVAGTDGELMYTSPAFTSVLGYPGAEAFNLRGEKLVHPEDRSGLMAAMAATDAAGAHINEEIRLRRASGEYLWFEAAITNLTDDPNVRGIVASLRDITRRKNAEDRLAHAALHDALTGLPNRTLILNRAEQMLARARQERTPVAALFLDLDDFKDINDTLGHEVGDQLLAAVGARLASVVRAGDTVGRLGGDEFVVLVEGVSLAAGVEVVAQHITDMLSTPFEIAAIDMPIEVTASIGIAEGERTLPGELLRDADIALYRAKAAGKRCAVVFSPQMQKALDYRRSIEVDLHSALDREQFFVLYQPTVVLSTGAMNGAEALVRWRHPQRGVVQPNDFIPELEASGLIVPIGRWVLHEACRQGAAWNRRGHPMTVSVNISPIQLDRDGIVDDVRTALTESGLDPGLLVLELTETTLMRDVREALARLQLLKAIGVRLAIDDFGTGYSSLVSLRQFPIDVLKIDQTFVAAIAHSKESIAIVHTLVQLGKVLELETVAEGVETEDQRLRLEAEEVDIGQGFLFSRPIGVAAMDQLLIASCAPDQVALGAPSPVPVRPSPLTLT